LTILQYGECSFANFVKFTQEASLDTNHPVFSHDALTSTRKELEKETPLLKGSDEATIEEIRRGDMAPP